MPEHPTVGADLESLTDWVEQFSDCVQNVDFDRAAQMMDRDVTSFSTLQNVVTGVEHFVEGQWKKVWPTISDFRIVTEELRAVVSPDRRLAAVAAPWSSTGYLADGTPFDRPGRATFVLARTDESKAWKAVHGHFSLNRGVPQVSHGPRA